MWNIYEVKQSARAKLSLSYWKSVLVALILAVVTGAGAGNAGAASGAQAQINNSGASSWQFYAGNGPLSYHWDFQFPLIATWLMCLLGAVIVVAALAGIAIHIFLMNPIESGCQRFFIINHEETGSTRIGEIFHSFNNGYLNVVKTLFLRDLYIILWSLLLLIPGIIKSYSYLLVPYILAEEPDMDNKEAFRLSREMMDGNKWHAFCLDLSFIGWHILNVFTFGLLGIFYVKPYQATASAEMYIAIRDHFMGRTDEGASNTTF